MSSTNRGGQRHVSDYYITPVPQVVAFLRTACLDGVFQFSDGLAVFDPCAGGDTKNGMSYSAAFETVCPNIIVVTNDIRYDSPAQLHHDYLDSRATFPKADLIITNPPFAIAEKIAERAIKETGQWAVMLLRLNFLGGQKRQGFWGRHPPSHIYIHPRRMGFDAPTQLRFVKGAG